MAWWTMSPQTSACSPRASCSIVTGPGVWPGAGSIFSPSSSVTVPVTMRARPASTTGSTESRNDPWFTGPAADPASSLAQCS